MGAIIPLLFTLEILAKRDLPYMAKYPRQALGLFSCVSLDANRAVPGRLDTGFRAVVANTGLSRGIRSQSSQIAQHLALPQGKDGVLFPDRGILIYQFLAPRDRQWDGCSPRVLLLTVAPRPSVGVANVVLSRGVYSNS